MTVQVPIKKKHTVKDLLNDHFDDYLRDPNRKLYLEPKHFEAVNKIKTCQSKKIGYAVYVCTSCGDTKFIYRSCKHRFCPTCGISETYRWAEQTLSRLINIKHHHITMTLPKPLRQLSKMNGDLIHNILFKQAARTLKDWFEHRHNIRPGIVSVLHTAGADLKYHPHVHMIVSAGGQNIESGQYITLKNKFLVKQRFLGKQFKINFRNAILDAFDKEEIKMHKRYNTTAQIKQWFSSMSDKHWIVSIQDPLDDVEQIVKYVGRYTKRACVSEYKIQNITDNNVALRFNDYKNTPRGGQPLQAIKSFSKTEFLDKLLQHVPNKRFRMVRYYGLYCSHYLSKIPEHLKIQINLTDDNFQFDEDHDWGIFEKFRKKQIRLGKDDPLLCKCCQQDYILYGIFYEDQSKNIIIYNSE